jgi:hypothetical protein
MIAKTVLKKNKVQGLTLLVTKVSYGSIWYGITIVRF